MGSKTIAAHAAKASNGMTAPFQLAADPTSGAGGTYAGRAQVGSLLVNTATGRLFVCTASGGGSVTWQLAGAQV